MDGSVCFMVRADESLKSLMSFMFSEREEEGG